MTHEELLAKMKELSRTFAYEPNLNFESALRAVVELHKPIKDEWIDYTTCVECRVPDDDYYSPEYPCQTIQAIEKELNG